MITNAANWQPSTSWSTSCSRRFWEIPISPPRLGNKCSWSWPSCPETAPSRASETGASSPAALAVCTSSSGCPVSFSVSWRPGVLSTALRKRPGREVRRIGFVLLDWNEWMDFVSLNWFAYGFVWFWIFRFEWWDMKLKWIWVGMEFSVHRIKCCFWNQNKRNVVEFISYWTANDFCKP